MRNTELKEQPQIDAQTLATLAPKTAVTIIGRQGGWFQVVSGETRGWVRLLHVSSQSPREGGPVPPELAAAARVATGRAGSGNIAVTTGIRGLSKEELQQAQPNTEELQRLEQQGVDEAQAAAYAETNGLKRRQVPYPPEPR